MPTRPAILGAVITALLLSGCTDSSGPPVKIHYTGDMRIQDQVQPVSAGNILSTPAPAAIPDDPYTAGGDPLGTDGGGLTSSKDGQTDPLTNSGGNAEQNRNRPIKNWYWIRGTVTGGSMEVKINGITVGQYTLHVDNEISDYLNAGSNNIEFIPAADSSTEPVTCHLDIVYSQQEEGALPVLTYDTSNPTLMGSAQTTVAQPETTPPPAPVAPTPAPGAKSLAMPTLPPIDPLHPPVPNQPVTLSFTAR